MYSSSVLVKLPGENIQRNLLEARVLYDYYQKVFSSLGSICGKSTFLFINDGSTVHIKLSIISLKHSNKKHFSVKASPHVHKSQEQFLENSFLPVSFQITVSSTSDKNTKDLVASIEKSLSRFMYSTDCPDKLSIDHWFPNSSIINTIHKNLLI